MNTTRKMDNRLNGRAWLTACMLVLGCGGPTAERPASAAPSSYPGTCALIGIDEVPAPIGQESDTVALVARYRPGGSLDGAPLGLRFEVARSRAHDLRQHLAAHPTVVCRAERGAEGNPAPVEVSPFEGQAGRPVP